MNGPVPSTSPRLAAVPAHIRVALLACSVVAAAVVTTLTLWPWLQTGVSMMLFVLAVVVASFFGGLAGGVTAALLSEIASVFILPEASASGFTVAIRFGALLAVAGVVASLSAQHRDVLRTLEQRVAARTTELEALNQHLLAQIAQRTRLERRLKFLVDRDPLTGLLNRRRFEEVLAEEGGSEKRTGRHGALLVIDLDHFKDVNDQLGHPAGDQLLKTVGDIIKGCVRKSDLVARLGGDEFGVLLRRVNAAQAALVADAIVKATRHRKVMLGGQPVVVTASVGLAMLDASPAEVLARADFAMYEAKRSGRGAVVEHAPTVGTRLASERSGERDRLRRAIDEGRFTLYGQPIVDLERSTVSQYELLLRPLDAKNHPLSPGSFLSAAERLGLTSLIDSWVVKEAILLIANQARAGRSLRLNVNISGQSMGDPGLVEVIDHTLRRTGVDPRQLVFEVTETAAITDMSEATGFVDRLRHRGCQFALDDFGTGFGSLYYLKHIPCDYLKIDGDFVHGVESATDTLVIEAIVGMARSMGKKTVAECVASPGVAERLRRSGVAYAQGFQLGVPRPVAQLFQPA